MNCKTFVLTPFTSVALVTYHVLKQSDPDARFIFTDNNPHLHGKKYDGVEIVSAEYALSFAGGGVILCLHAHIKALKEQYSSLGFTDINNYENFLDQKTAETVLPLIDMAQVVSVNPAMGRDIENFISCSKCFFVPDYAQKPNALILNLATL